MAMRSVGVLVYGDGAAHWSIAVAALGWAFVYPVFWV